MQNLIRTSQNELALKLNENRNLMKQIKNLEGAIAEARNEAETIKKNSNIENENLRQIHETTIKGYEHDLQNNRVALIELEKMLQECEEKSNMLVDQLNSLKVSVSGIEKYKEKLQKIQSEFDHLQNEHENYRLKKENEIKDLEDNLRKSVDNLKNMNSKYENALEEFAYKEKELKFKLLKEQNYSKSLDAKLEKSKIEYSIVNNRILFYKKKVQDYQNVSLILFIFVIF